MEIDAIDNGVSLVDDYKLYKYKYGGYSFISKYNSPDVANAEEQKCRFIKCSKILQSIFECYIKGEYQELIDAERQEKEVDDAFENRFNIHSSGKILELESRCTMANKFINRKDKNKEILFYLSPYNDTWKIYTIQETFGKNRKDLISFDEANDDDVIFIHKSKFMGQTKSRKSAFDTLVKSLEK